LAKIEAGKRLPSLKIICALADILEIGAHELLIEETQGRPDHKKKQLIKILTQSNEKELNIYFVIIEALRKSQN